ncbi:hypothetical protein J6590_008741 [Homalodisca vitripennis]|nr:hypothetical protein J6590_008741 [Homalodisca vitripennis]
MSLARMAQYLLFWLLSYVQLISRCTLHVIALFNLNVTNRSLKIIAIAPFLVEDLTYARHHSIANSSRSHIKKLLVAVTDQQRLFFEDELRNFKVIIVASHRSQGHTVSFTADPTLFFKRHLDTDKEEIKWKRADQCRVRPSPRRRRVTSVGDTQSGSRSSIVALTALIGENSRPLSGFNWILLGLNSTTITGPLLNMYNGESAAFNVISTYVPTNPIMAASVVSTGNSLFPKFNLSQSLGFSGCFHVISTWVPNHPIKAVSVVSSVNAINPKINLSHLFLHHGSLAGEVPELHVYLPVISSNAFIIDTRCLMAQGEVPELHVYLPVISSNAFIIDTRCLMAQGEVPELHVYLPVISSNAFIIDTRCLMAQGGVPELHVYLPVISSNAFIIDTRCVMAQGGVPELHVYLPVISSNAFIIDTRCLMAQGGVPELHVYLPVMSSTAFIIDTRCLMAQGEVQPTTFLF